MFPDGICRVREGYYTKTIQFWDVNYQLAQQEAQTAMFEEWCRFLNFFDSSVHFELSFMNLPADMENMEHSIRLRTRQDGLDDKRQDYSRVIQSQMKGMNGLAQEAVGQ